ncbi:allantoin permease [Sporosarcina luteola]|uniref:allantoin permease n=1 Tax=Sporosarcina luteola TaxID=582850 RepID=UPI0020414953|nr:cytosine permease [Sporosarcina luteola]MCM3710708.1 cytosine permease [Sporosarcina luteola]
MSQLGIGATQQKGMRAVAQEEIKVTQDDVTLFKSRGYENEDLLPKTKEKRNMGPLNYFTLWMGNLHNIPNYAAVGGLIVLGIAPLNIMIALILGAIITGLFMAFNGQAGSKYGIPFALHLRATYGAAGAKLPGILRGIVVAIGWFGLQTFVGSQALLIIIGKLWPSFLKIGGDVTFLGIGMPGLVCFIIFWLVNVALGISGSGFLNKFNTILTVFIYVLFISMGIWGVIVGGGFSNILNYAIEGPTQSINPLFAYILIISAVLAFWAAPATSVSDFTQNAKSNRDQMIGQSLSLIIGYIIFAFTSISILIGSSIYYGMEQWDVLNVINKWDSLPAIFFAMLVLLLITVNSNVTANVTPAAYQLTALFPKWVTYRRGVFIASIIGFLIMPWKLMENPDSIYTFLSGVGAILGPVTGVMIYQFFFVTKKEIDLDQLYYDSNDPTAVSKYKGVNKNAYIATILGVAVSLSGNFIPLLSSISDISWIIGFATAFISYGLLVRFSPTINNV